MGVGVGEGDGAGSGVAVGSGVGAGEDVSAGEDVAMAGWVVPLQPAIAVASNRISDMGAKSFINLY